VKPDPRGLAGRQLRAKIFPAIPLALAAIRASASNGPSAAAAVAVTGEDDRIDVAVIAAVRGSNAVVRAVRGMIAAILLRHAGRSSSRKC